MGGVGATSLSQVLFLPTSLGEAEQTFIIVCDNCQIKELAISGGLACVPSGGAGAAAPGFRKLLPWLWWWRSKLCPLCPRAQ